MTTEKRQPEGDGAPLTDKLLAAIARHLNQDHLEDLLACARVKAGADWAEQVQAIGLDAAGIDLEARDENRVESLRINFPAPAKGVLDFQRIMGAAIAESRAELGWAPSVGDR